MACNTATAAGLDEPNHVQLPIREKAAVAFFGARESTEKVGCEGARRRVVVPAGEETPADLAGLKADETTDDHIAELRAEVREQYETQSNPYYATSRIWDDGLIEPEQTRDVLGLCLALAARQDEPAPAGGLVYRM